MRESKYDKLLMVSVALLIISAVLLLISGYNIYFKKQGPQALVIGKTAVEIPLQLRDSLEKVYSNTVTAINNNLSFADNATSDRETQTKMAELATLRQEIVTLLANKNDDSDLQLAKVKIEELQQKVAVLQNRYTGVESENKRLQSLINQLLNGKSSAGTANTAAVTPDKQGNVTSTAVNSNSPFAGALHLFAVANTNTKEQETTEADEAEKIVGTFVVKNLPAKGNGELLVVILQPDGKVLKNSVWESGTFETVEGKKIYSRKLYAETTTEEKQLNFSLTPDKFLKGDYTMQIWYNGSMIGKMVKTLS